MEYLLVLLVALAGIYHQVNADCNGKADVVFVVDESTSIDGTEYNLQRDFLKAVVDRFTVGPDHVLFGAGRYSTGGSIRFLLDDYITNAAVNAALDAWSQIGGSTNHKQGFLQARDILADDGNRANVPDIVVFLTDGIINEGGAPFSVVQQLKDDGAIIVTVSIGDESPLDDMENKYASDPSLHVYIESFDAADDPTTIDIVVDAICESMQLPCTKCKRFNDQKIGFVSDPYDCTKYYTCFRKNNGENSELSHMDCPTGTMFNSEHAQDGVPCVDADESCENPMNPEDDDEVEHFCPFTTNPEDANEYGVMQFGSLVGRTRCDEGIDFDDSSDVCRCLVAEKDNCQCILHIDFDEDVMDHGCNDSPMSNSDPQVAVNNNNEGFFRGFKDNKNNGAHLSTDVMNGAFSPTCNQWGQHEITVALWFRYDYEGAIEGKVAGLVSYCTGDNGRNLYIEIRGDVVCVGLKTIDNPIVEFCSTTTINQLEWYYVALVYEDPLLNLYLTPEASYPDATVEAQAAATGCLEPGNCGFIIGAGAGARASTFFSGKMDDVMVYREADYLACVSDGEDGEDGGGEVRK